MKSISILLLGAVLFYSLFSQLDLPVAAFICLSLIVSYLIYRLPTEYIAKMKYPFIFLLLAVTSIYLINPSLKLPYLIDGLLFFVSFYGLSFFLVTIDEKSRGLFKEATALSVVFLCAAFNLSMIGKALFILHISCATAIFLFVLGKEKLLFVLVFITLIVIALMIKNGISITGGKIKPIDINKYILLGASFVFLTIGLINFVKNRALVKRLTFFGAIYLSMDIILSLVFKVSMGILYQPVIGLFILSPIIGMSLKRKEKGMA